MDSFERMKHFNRWFERNSDITLALAWTTILELYAIFMQTNPEYSIQDAVEENEGLELNNQYNAFAEKYKDFNKYTQGEWEL